MRADGTVPPAWRWVAGRPGGGRPGDRVWSDRFTNEDAALQVGGLGRGLDAELFDERPPALEVRRPQGRVVDVVVFINGKRTKHVAGENITRLTIAKLPNRG